MQQPFIHSLLIATALASILLTAQPAVFAGHHPGKSNIPVVKAPQQGTEDQPSQELRERANKFFETYRDLDRQSNPALIDLYSDDAVIHASIERAGGGILTEKFNKDEFKQELLRSIKDERVRTLNKETVLENLQIKVIKHEGRKEQVTELSFDAHHKHSALSVHWLMKQDESGNLRIFEEHSLSYGKVRAQTKKPQS